MDKLAILDLLSPEDVLRIVDIEAIEATLDRLDSQAAFWKRMLQIALDADVDRIERVDNKPKAPAVDDDDDEDERPPTDPIGKRKSGSELVEARVERLVLVLNQIGECPIGELAEHIHCSAEVTKYAIKKYGNGAIVRKPTEDWKWVATRVSKKWDAGDEAMFGQPRFTVSDETEEPVEQAAQAEPAEPVVEAAARPEPEATIYPKANCKGIGLIPARYEHVLWLLNKLGPMKIADVAYGCNLNDYQARYVLGKTAVVKVKGHKFGASRVSQLWEPADGEPVVSTGKAYGHEALKAAWDSGEEEEGEREEEADEPTLRVAPRPEPEVSEDPDDGKRPIGLQKSETWVQAKDAPKDRCDLCDTKWSLPIQKVCIETTYMGTKVMCYGCARKSGCSAPPSKISVS